VRACARARAPMLPDGARDKGIKGNGDNDKDKDKPRYLREMEKYKSMSCSADTKHDRPLVK